MDPLSLALMAVTGIGSLFGGNKKSETQNTNTNESGTQDSAARTLSSGVEDSLTKFLQNLSGGALKKSTDSLTGEVDKITGNPIEFDPVAYVKGITEKADADLDEGLSKNLNALFSGIGSNSGGNSMAALLENKMRRQNATESAGIKQTATAQSVGIQDQLRSSEAGELVGINNQLGKLFETLIGGVKGAVVTEFTSSKKNSSGTGKSESSSIGFDGSNLANMFKGTFPIKY